MATVLRKYSAYFGTGVCGKQDSVAEAGRCVGSFVLTAVNGWGVDWGWGRGMEYRVG